MMQIYWIYLNIDILKMVNIVNAWNFGYFLLQRSYSVGFLFAEKFQKGLDLIGMCAEDVTEKSDK